MKKTAELKVLPISVLKPAEYNPRKKLKPGDKEYKKIKDSIEEFGFADPLVINADMTIIGGHQRLNVAIDLGYTEVPCAVVDVDKTREKALNIALNKITGEWDEQMLADLLTDLKEADYDLDYTGFEAPEVEQLFSNIYDKKVKEDDFDVDKELQQPCFSQLGDLWLLGKHRVICGDSTGEEIYTRLMDGQLANLVLTDPPYNVDVEETAGKIMNDNMGDQEFYNFLLSAYRCMHANLADDGSIYVWHADTEGINFRTAFKDAGFYLSGCCIWVKNSLVLGRSPYQWRHEPCLFGWKQKGKHQWYGDRKQTTVWEYDKPRSSKDHPTMKPVQLMSYPIKNSTMTNGVVLDPFLGSGSTLIACCETDRVCRGIELDPKFVDCIVKRYIEWAGGRYDDVFVIRDGQKLRFDEVASFEPQEAEGN
jgi:DNA modification methylase